MNMDAMVMTVRAHDARSAMYRMIFGRHLMVAAGPGILARRRAMMTNGVSAAAA
jgi:hypothetical protein